MKKQLEKLLETEPVLIDPEGGLFAAISKLREKPENFQEFLSLPRHQGSRRRSSG